MIREIKVKSRDRKRDGIVARFEATEGQYRIRKPSAHVNYYRVEVMRNGRGRFGELTSLGAASEREARENVMTWSRTQYGREIHRPALERAIQKKMDKISSHKPKPQVAPPPPDPIVERIQAIKSRTRRSSFLFRPTDELIERIRTQAEKTGLSQNQFLELAAEELLSRLEGRKS